MGGGAARVTPGLAARMYPMLAFLFGYEITSVHLFMQYACVLYGFDSIFDGVCLSLD